MKKQLLAVVALFATTGLFAMQAPKTFNYETYKFAIPAQGLNVGDTFTVINADPKIMTPETLKDASGKDWAKKTSSVYPYAGKNIPGKGTLTFKVLAMPAVQIKAAPGQVYPMVVPMRTEQAGMPAKPETQFKTAQEGFIEKPKPGVATVITAPKPQLVPEPTQLPAPQKVAIVSEMEKSKGQVAQPTPLAFPKLESLRVPVPQQIQHETITMPAAQVGVITKTEAASKMTAQEQLIKDKAQYEADLMKMPASNIGIALDSAVRNAYIEKLELLIKILKKRNIDINNTQALGLTKNPLQIARLALVTTPQKIKVLELLKNAGAKLQSYEVAKDINEAILAADYELTKWLIDYGLANNALSKNELEGYKATAERYSDLYGADKKGALSRIKFLMIDTLKKVNQ